MNDTLDSTLDKIKRDLAELAREAEIERLSELAISSHLIETTNHIDWVLQHGKERGVLTLTIGSRAFDALGIHPPDAEGNEAIRTMVNPGEIYELDDKYLIPTHTLSGADGPIHEPVYGSPTKGTYFDLAKIGATLNDGGSLTFTSKRDRG